MLTDLSVFAGAFTADGRGGDRRHRRGDRRRGARRAGRAIARHAVARRSLRPARDAPRVRRRPAARRRAGGGRRRPPRPSPVDVDRRRPTSRLRRRRARACSGDRRRAPRAARGARLVPRQWRGRARRPARGLAQRLRLPAAAPRRAALGRPGHGRTTPAGRRHRPRTCGRRAPSARWIVGDVAGHRPCGSLGRSAISARKGTRPDPAVVLHMLGAQAMVDGQLTNALDAGYRQRPTVAAADHGRSLVLGALQALTLSYGGDPAAERRRPGTARPTRRHRARRIAAFAWYAAGEAVMDGRRRRSPRPAWPGPSNWPSRPAPSFVVGIAGTIDLVHRSARRRPTRGRRASSAVCIDHWRRAGVWATQWTTLRAIAAAARPPRPRTSDAAILVGAIVTTESGHRLFGDDELAIAELAQQLRPTSDHEGYDAAFRLRGRARRRRRRRARAPVIVTADGRAIVTSAVAQLRCRASILPTISWVRASLPGWKPPQRTSR